MLDLYFKRHFWTFELAVLGIAGLLSARVVNTLLAALLQPDPSSISRSDAPPQEPDRSSSIEIAAFVERNVFGSERVSSADPPEPSSSCERSSLNARLVATIVSIDPERSVAVFNDAATTFAHYRGERLLDRASVVQIGWREVRVDHDGRCEVFVLDSEPLVALAAPMIVEPRLGDGIRSVKQGVYEIPRGELENILTRMNELATQARIVPNVHAGVANGFRLTAIRPNSLYTKIGLQNGDVIHKINGYEINSPQVALELYVKLKDADNISVEVLRSGKPHSLSYDIK